MTPAQLAQVRGGTRYTHHCGAHWTGRNRSHCSGCHRLFNVPSGFDMHRKPTAGRNRCLDPATLSDDAGNLLLQELDGIWYARRDGEKPSHWS